MSNKKLTDLTSGGVIQTGDEVYVVREGNSRRAVFPSILDKVTTTITSSGTFTIPSGVSKIEVMLWGAGGGGGGTNKSGECAGGGAGGGFAWGVYNVTPEDVITVTVGSGGSGGSAGNNGSSGGNTSFGTLISATGGAGGYKNPLTSSNVATGGIGSNGSIMNISGCNGGLGVTVIGTSANIVALGGSGGGVAFFGPGAEATPFEGFDATIPGTGGSGGGGNGGSFAGGDGAAGIIILKY